MNFLKYSANGNDFILLPYPASIPSKEAVKDSCDRHFGIGADGMLILENGNPEPRMRIFNADGNEADMCANGLRIAFTYLSNQKRELKLRTRNGLYSAELVNGKIRVEMSEIHDAGAISIDPAPFQRSYFVSTGVPHIVLLAASVAVENFNEIVLPFRNYPGLRTGANVNLVEVPNTTEQSAIVRTFERGVEGETLSCGTGLTASALALREWFGWMGHIHLRSRGGDHVIDLGEKVTFSGDVKLCFSGEIKL